MIPALAVFGAGTRRGIPIPVPVILLWPLVGLVWVAISLVMLFASRKWAARDPLVLASAGIAGLFQLSGLRIDVRSRRGERVSLVFI